MSSLPPPLAALLSAAFRREGEGFLCSGLSCQGSSPELRREASLAWLWMSLFLSCSEVRSVQWFRGLAPDRSSATHTSFTSGLASTGCGKRRMSMSLVVAATAIVCSNVTATAAVASHLTDVLTRLAVAHRLSSSTSHPHTRQLPSSSQGLREHSSEALTATLRRQYRCVVHSNCRASLTVFSAAIIWVLVSSSFAALLSAAVSAGRRGFSLLLLVVPGLSPELRR